MPFSTTAKIVYLSCFSTVTLSGLEEVKNSPDLTWVNENQPCKSVYPLNQSWSSTGAFFLDDLVTFFGGFFLLKIISDLSLFLGHNTFLVEISSIWPFSPSLGILNILSLNGKSPVLSTRLPSLVKVHFWKSCYW